MLKFRITSGHNEHVGKFVLKFYDNERFVEIAKEGDNPRYFDSEEDARAYVPNLHPEAEEAGDEFQRQHSAPPSRPVAANM